MSNEQKEPETKKPIDQLALWLSIGIALGAGLGVIFDQLPLGVAIGLALGTSMGVALSPKTKKIE